jgi:hypothetical protein
MSETPMTMAEAMARIHEIDRMYPRIPSKNPMSPTVMESDREWLSRNPQVDERTWRRLWAVAKGEVAA